MTTKIIVIIGVSIATVVLMFVLGRMADGKSNDTEKKDASRRVERIGSFCHVRRHPFLACDCLRAWWSWIAGLER